MSLYILIAILSFLKSGDAYSRCGMYVLGKRKCVVHYNSQVSLSLSLSLSLFFFLSLSLHFVPGPFSLLRSGLNHEMHVFKLVEILIIEPQHEISNNVVCSSSKASDQPAHTRSLIRAFASHLNIL